MHRWPAVPKPLNSALHREVEVGVGHHHERVLPAELEAGGLEVAPAELTDPAADVGRAREPDLVDDPGVKGALEALERPRTVGQHELERPDREPGVQDQLRERLGRRGRVLGRLPHDRVAAQQGRHEVPGRHRDREVAGGASPPCPRVGGT